MPIPSQIVQNPDGSVDVNGDGKSNGVFMGSQNFGLYDITTQRKRESANASFQMDLDHGFKLTSDYFYAHQIQHERNVGIQFNSTNWQGATYVPLQSTKHRQPPRSVSTTRRATQYAASWAGSQIYTTQVYEKWPGDVESYSQVIRRESTAQNFNLQLDFDNGGPFTGERARHPRNGRQEYIETDINISNSDGCLWADPNRLYPAGPSSIQPNWAVIGYSTPTAFPRTRCRSLRISGAAISRSACLHRSPAPSPTPTAGR